MVGPILISVAVPPPIWAAGAATGQASTTNAPTRQILETKRIDPLPGLFLIFDGSCATGRNLIVIKTCHVGGMDAIHNCGRPLAGDGWQALPKLRNLPVVQRPLPITVLAARHVMRTKILSRLSKWLCAAIVAASA